MTVPSITGRVVTTIAVNATLLNLGILALCGWHVATKQKIPDILLGAFIGNAGSALGALGSVLNSTKPEPQVNVEHAQQVGPQENAGGLPLVPQPNVD